MDDTAALLGSAAIKQRLAGVTGLLEQLKRQDAPPEASATLIPHVLPCLRDHNSKIALGALEILELLVARVSEATLRTYLKLLWLSLVERLGDNKLQVREKAVDVVVQISVVLDAASVLDRLKLCMSHKNWRTREQCLHAVWRVLERHALFKERQDELLDDVVKLLEDSSKDVREAAITALEKFYTHIGPSLLSDLEYKNIRATQFKTLQARFERIPTTDAAPQDMGPEYENVPASHNALPDELSSILSSYDLQVSSSSSSMARYLASVRSRTLNEAKVAAADGERSPSQASSTSSNAVPDLSTTASFGAGGNDIAEKEVQKQLGLIFDKLNLDNNWDKRVDGLKMLQKLARRCAKASTALPLLSQGLRPIRERLCQQVSDLRSSVSREACQTIETLANTLGDEFNAHAEICLGNLLKATYVTIQVISTAADSTIRSMIESTGNGYARVIPKLIECAKSRNQVLRFNAVCYLTLTLQRWSTSFLSKHSDMFVPILPALLQDALGDVRAQSRKCYWSFHHLFPDEAQSVFARLDGSTQRNVKDDPSKFTAGNARKADYSSMDIPKSQGAEVTRSGLRTANGAQPPVSAPAALNSVTFSDEQSANESAPANLPRRVLGGSSSATGGDAAEEGVLSSRVLSQGPMRVGLASRAKAAASKDSSAPSNERKKSAAAGPLRVRSAPKPAQVASTPSDSVYTSRHEPSTASFHTSSTIPASKAQRIQLSAEAQAPSPMEVDEGEPRGPKRLPVVSMPSPTASNASSSRTNSSRGGDSGDVKAKPARAATVKPVERPKTAPAPLPVPDRLEEALRNIESRSWSTRLEAAEYVGRMLEKRVDQIASGPSTGSKVDGRILLAFMKHLSDAHYRVSQGVLKNFLPLLKLANNCERLVPHLKTVLPKLFQKFIDTKESIRGVAKENLEYIASAVDSSTLAALVIAMLGDGSNMKVKAAMCHYLRELLPGAEGYMKHGTSNSHMRAFLLKIALLMDSDVPVSVSSACGDLVAAAAQLYGPEMEVALGLLPPSKRLVVSKALKAKRIVLNLGSSLRPPLSSAAAPHSTRSRDDDDDNHNMEPRSARPERSRKRPESPSVSSSSPPRQNSQKRINTTSQPASEDPRPSRQPATVEAVKPADAVLVHKTVSGDASFSRSTLRSSPGTDEKKSLQLEDLLHILEQNNLSAADVKRALYKTLAFIETGSSETWDRCFGRLLLLLLDAATDKGVYALKVLQRLVEAHPSRAQMFFELLLQRLLDAIGDDQVDVARHLMERILHDLVRSTSDVQQTLSTLIPLLSRSEPPALQVVLCLVKNCLQGCEKRSAEASAFLRKHDVADRLMGVLTRRLDHASSSVRKNAVDCLVALHFATTEDSAIVPKYLAAELDDTRRRLVEIFIDRAKMERHHIGLSS